MPHRSRVPLLAIAAVALALGACDRSPAGPPDGVPVRMTHVARVPYTQAAPYGVAIPPVVTAAGDSIAIDVVLGDSGCSDVSPSAGWAGGDLVITVTWRENGMICTADMARALFRIVVRPAPAGTYDVRVMGRTLDRRGRQQGAVALLQHLVALP